MLINLSMVPNLNLILSFSIVNNLSLLNYVRRLEKKTYFTKKLPIYMPIKYLKYLAAILRSKKVINKMVKLLNFLNLK